MTLNNVPFDGLLTFTRSSPAWSHGPDGKLVEHAINVPRIGYDPATGLPDGMVIESFSTNLISNNRDFGFQNGGAHTSVETTEVESPIPGAKVWKLIKGPSTDSNFSNTQGPQLAASTNAVISGWVFVPADSTATAVRIGSDGASANGAELQYDMTRKGSWQRIWRAYTSHLTNANAGGQIRASGVTEGQHIYASLLQVELGARVTSTILSTGSPGSTQARGSDICRISDSAFNRIFPPSDPRTNLIRGSNNFDNSVWGVKSGITVTPNYAADPNGGGTIACRILETAANTDHYIEQGLSADGMPAGATISASVMVKADGRSSINMTMYGASYVGAFSIMVNDLDTVPTHNAGSASGGAAIHAVQVHPVGVAGWHRIVISGTLPTAGGRLRIALINSATTYVGDVTKGAILANAQVEISPVTLPVNLAANPEAAQNWSRSRTTIETNVTAEPGLTGYLTADMVKCDATSGQHAAWSFATITPGQIYTASISLKKAVGYDQVTILFLNSNFSSSITTRISLTDGAILFQTKTSAATMVNTHVVPEGDGWFRVYCTGNPDPASSSVALAVYLDNGASYLGDGTSGTYVHGIMISPDHTNYVKISSLVSSPVPTTTAGPATEFAGQAAQGFAVIEATVVMPTPTATAGQNIIQFDDGGNNLRLLLRNNGGSSNISAYFLPLSTGGTNIGALAAGVPFRCAVTWRYGVAKICGPSGAVIQVSSGSLKPKTNMRLGVSASSNEQLCGNIRDFALGAKFLTDAQLQAAAVVGADIATATR